jgi:hypothetical protein
VLYVTMLAMTVVLAGGALVVGLEWAPPVHGPGEFAIFMFRIATFQTMFRVARILGVYALLVPLGAFAVVLMGRGWTRILLLISWLVYGIYQIDPHRFGWPFPESAYFHPYAYQVLFLHLVALGYHRDWFARFFDFRRQRALFIVSAGVFLALIVLHACQHAVLPVRLDMQLDRIFDGRFLRPGRLLALVFVGPAFYLAITYFWLPIHRHVGGLFMPLGRHALYCYAMHAPFVVLFDRLSSSWAALGRWAALPNAVAQLTVLGILCAMVRFRVLFRLFPVEAKPAR